MKKSVFIFTLLIFILGRLMVPAAFVFAAPEPPSTPSVPELPKEPDQPTTPEEPDSPQAPEEPQEPQIPEEPQLPKNADPAPEKIVEDPPEEINNESAPSVQSSSDAGDNNVGDTKINTGDSNSSGSIINAGNENLSATPISTSPSMSIANTGSVAIEDSSANDQQNKAGLNNNLSVSSDSGDNSASRNVGTSEITTGDANVSGTIINAVNTNVDGVMVSEFNVDDNYSGDLILDFATNCISGCGGEIDVVNSDNGSDSQNSGSVDTFISDATFQGNDADVENQMILEANTGGNVANDNTGGNSTIKTGDANVSGSVVNFLNNNIAGNVVLGVVNIFGDLVGDIIIPESVLQALGLNMENSSNGSASTNDASANLASADTYYQFNQADIINNLDLSAVTGDNETSNNTSGNNTISTGDANVDAQVTNIANNNIIGGNWWIVLVNDGGSWIGKIIALPGSVVGSNYAGSSGTNFVADQGNNAINITNAGNGDNSKNSGSVNSEAQNTVVQNNNAKIINNISLSANTGENSASRNTGGDNKIETGDANVIFNLVNFVNNNFIGNAKVFLTVVNVFGSWLGDIIGPGAQKEVADDSSSTATTSSSSNNSSDSNSSSSPSNGSSDSTQVVTVQNTLNPFVPKIGKIALVSASATDPASTSEQDPSVLGAEDTANNKIKINLAWGLLLIPGYFGFVIVKRLLLKD